MSICKTDIKGKPYFKVSRAWNKQEIQRFIPIGKNEAKALKEATKEDNSLASRQYAYNELIKLTGEKYFHADGSIVGLNRRFEEKKGRNPVEIFYIRLHNGGDVKYTSVSIDHHGFDLAFKTAVEKIADILDLSLKIKKMMFDAKCHYDPDAPDVLIEETSESLFETLLKEANKFKKQK